MRYSIKVKPGSSQEKVVEVDEGLVVYLHARPHDGQANEALVKMLAKYFGVPKTRLKIVGGLRSREKIIEVLD